MDNATYIALSRMDAQQRSMEVIANNIANANTDGFKAQHVLFSDYLVDQDGVSPVTGGSPHSYAQDRATYLDQRDGTLVSTGNPLDVAISGDGYFTVQTPQGTRLTRAGHFTVSQDGTLSDPSGHAVLGDDGEPIQFSPSDANIRIAGDGTISTDNGTVGRFGIVSPDAPGDLRPEGKALYVATNGTAPATEATILQGSVEGSNVQTITELTSMLETQRKFEFTSRLVESEGERQQNAIDKLAQGLNS